MNKTEKEYAAKRIRQIYKIKEQAIEDKCPELNKSISRRDKINMIVSKKAKVKKSINYHSYHFEIDEVFDWPQDKEKSKSQIKCNAEIKVLKVEAQIVEDEIMLGDSQKALQLLRKFAQS